jgi:Kelch motif
MRFFAIGLVVRSSLYWGDCRILRCYRARMEAPMRSRLVQLACGLFLFPLMVLPFVRLNAPGNSATSRAGSLAETAHMQIARASHSSTLLPNGEVLIAGGFGGSGTESNPYRSTEIYDPRTGSFQPAGNMTIGRSGHTATFLKNGKLLIAGGWTGRYNVRRSAELYDPSTGVFTPTGDMVIERAGSIAALLPDGRVLLAGGEDRNENALASAEIYDPTTGKVTRTGDMTEPRGEATATALRNGKVLIVGGGSGHYPSQNVYRSAEVYDPATGKFTATGQMTVGRHKHAAVLLASGKVLVVGGSDNRDWHGEYSSAEIYDPAAGKFSATGTMSAARFKLPFAAVLLNNGTVLVAGGGSFAEVYDERKGSFSKVEGSLGAARFFASATVLPDGNTLITGGYAESGGSLPSTSGAWIYKP